MIVDILYPLLFSLIPIFVFSASNIQEIDKESIFLISIIDILIILGLWFLLTYIMQLDGHISSGILFYLIILFYTPAYKLNRLKSRYSYQYIIKYIFYGLLTCAIVYFAFIQILLIFVFSTILILNIIYIISNLSKTVSENIQQDIVDINVDDENKPDIYHIILDGYLGREALKDLTGFDNNEFYEKLKEMGFETYSNIYSNYNYTSYSIPSIMNMNYFHNYMKAEELNSDMYLKDKLGYGYYRIIKSKVIFSLKKAGYTIITHGKTIFSEHINDLCQNLVDISDTKKYNINANQTIINYLKTTIIGSFFMVNIISNRNHISYIKETFQELGNSYNIKSPLYSFFHILAPHPPFCFNNDGSVNEKFSSMLEYYDINKDYLEAYKNHMIYINELTIKALNQLIETIKVKNRKAIILLHSDHGSLETKPCQAVYNTLLAVYKYNFNNNKEIFKENITLVNMMPYLFNYIFNTNIATYENNFYYSDIMSSDLNTRDVTEQIIKFLNR